MVRNLLVLAGLLLLAVAPALAATSTWNNGDGTGMWNNAANWSGSVPGVGDVAVFDNTTADNCTIDIEAVPTTFVMASNYAGVVIFDGAAGSLVTDSIYIAGGVFNCNNRAVVTNSFVTAGTPTITPYAQNWTFKADGFISTDQYLSVIDITDGGAGSVVTTLNANLTAGMVIVRQNDTLKPATNQTLTIEPTANNFLPSDNGGVVMSATSVNLGAASRTHDGTIRVANTLTITGNDTTVTLTRDGTAAMFVDSLHFTATASYNDGGGTTTCRSLSQAVGAKLALGGTLVFNGVGVFDATWPVTNLTVAGTNAALTVANATLRVSGDITVGAADDTLILPADARVVGTAGSSELKSGTPGTATNVVFGKGSRLSGYTIADVAATGEKPVAVGCIPGGNVVGLTFRR